MELFIEEYKEKDIEQLKIYCIQVLKMNLY